MLSTGGGSFLPPRRVIPRTCIVAHSRASMNSVDGKEPPLETVWSFLLCLFSQYASSQRGLQGTEKRARLVPEARVLPAGEGGVVPERGLDTRQGQRRGQGLGEGRTGRDGFMGAGAPFRVRKVFCD